jgi:alpha-D-xyloside xylohydrolase
MQVAAATGLPPMRPLFVDFSGDQLAWGIDDEFMFGPDILVAPVLEAGATSRAVYLPAGTKWTDAWTGESLAGGSTVAVDAPIERIPVFMRGEATLPLR